MNEIIKLRRDTEANWASANPILAQGEPGSETDTNRLKVGDGVTAWGAMPYITTPISADQAAINAALTATAAQALATAQAAQSQASANVAAIASVSSTAAQALSAALAAQTQSSANTAAITAAAATLSTAQQAIVSTLIANALSNLTVPAAITSFTAGTPTSTAQPLSWTVTGTAPITYTVSYRLTSAGGSYTPASSGITGTSYTVTGLTPNTAYDYQVVPTNPVGTGPVASALNKSTGVAGVDSRPGWFAAPSNAATVNTAALITSRTILANGTNGGKTGTANPVTTIGTNYCWFAIAASGAPTFRDDTSQFTGGFTLTGSPFSDANGTVWYLYKSDYAASYSGKSITLI